MKIRIILAIWLLLPLPALAESVAVLPVTYQGDRKPEQLEDRRQRVEDTVIQTIQNLGLDPVTGADVARETSAFSPLGGGGCDSVKCVEEVASRVEADIGVSVALKDDAGMIDIKIYTAYADPVEMSTYDTFSSILRRVSESVDTSLKKAVRYVRSARQTAEEAEQVETQDGYRAPLNLSGQIIDDELLGEGGRQDSGTSGGGAGKGRKRLAPPGFWSSFGITLALGAGYGVVEGIGYSKWQADTSPPEDDRNTVETMQLTSRILAGATAAGVITTSLLAIFTDFGKKRVRSRDDEEEEEEDEEEDHWNMSEDDDDDEDEDEAEKEEEDEDENEVEEDEEEDEDKDEDEDRRDRKRRRFFDRDDDDDDDEEDFWSRLNLRMIPAFGPTGGGFMIGGTF